QVVAGRGEDLEVVGAIGPGGAVHLGATLLELRQHLGALGRALEHQVLEQVRHAGLAVAFVARADEVGDVHRQRRLGRVGEEQHAQAVRQRVLGDAIDGDDLGRRGVSGGGGGGGGGDREQGRAERGGQSHAAHLATPEKKWRDYLASNRQAPNASAATAAPASAIHGHTRSRFGGESSRSIASIIACADGNRSSADLRIARMIRSSSAGGIAGSIERGAGGGSWMCARISASSSSVRNGRCPVTIS